MEDKDADNIRKALCKLFILWFWQLNLCWNISTESTVLVRSGYRGVHAHSCIIGNQGKMAENLKICIGTQSQLFLPEFIYLILSLWKEYLTSSKKQYNKPGVQRSPLKTGFSHTFFVIRQYQNYITCMEKLRFSKNWSQTSLHSRFSVLFFWTRKLLFSKRKHQIYEFREN